MAAPFPRRGRPVTAVRQPGRGVNDRSEVLMIARVPTIALVLACGALAVPAAAAGDTTFMSVVRHDSQTARGVTSREDVVRAGTRIGTSVVRCSFERHRDRCRLRVTLPRGTIGAAFVDTGAGLAGRLTVTGGTGAYEGAAGAGAYRYLDRAGSRMAITLPSPSRV
jgi:hypothetical protein